MHYSLDTNILVRFFLNDKEFSKVENLLEDEENSIEISDIVLGEMIYVFEKHYKVTRETINEFTKYLIQKSNININRKWLEECMNIYINRKTLSFVDVASLVYARLNKALPLLTFDKALVKYSPNEVEGL